MLTTVTPATAVDEPVLRNLTQLYAYDFAEIAGWDIPDSGRFPDEIIDGCFADSGRHPFLLRVDGRLAGFAIVDTRSRLTGDEGVRDVAEFFVARPYRGRGVGAEAARALFDRFGGRWEVRQTAKNAAAIAFWRKVIGRYTGGRFEETMHDGPRWRGPVQTFVAAG
jgi:predicted acetyltransferase